MRKKKTVEETKKQAHPLQRNAGNTREGKRDKQQFTAKKEKTVQDDHDPATGININSMLLRMGGGSTINIFLQEK